MNRKKIKILLFLLAFVLLLTGCRQETVETVPTTQPVATTEIAATLPETEPVETAPAETEPQEERFLLTFVGDCTFGSNPTNYFAGYGFIKTVGEDYRYPFQNVIDYFENDDFTMINLEGPLCDSGYPVQKKHTFRGPTAYTQIMTGSSVEAVTLANNHTEDFGKAGYASTTQALSDAGITYVEKNGTAMYTTDSGLKIGLYAASFDFSVSDIKKDIAQLRADSAEIVVCAFHWGTEGAYRPSSAQQSYAHQAIDAGADIVYGNHPHVLQKIEEYGDGIIYYSLGNCSFGGSGSPQDYDAAILQQEVIRDADGNVSLGELTIIPITVSSAGNYNNYQPTPLEEGSKAYERAMSKLDGSFKGADLVVDYSKLDNNKDKATEPPASSGGSSGTSTGGESGSASGDAGTSSGDSGNSSGDAGSSSGDAGSSSGDAGSSAGDSGGSSGGGEAPDLAGDVAG